MIKDVIQLKIRFIVDSTFGVPADYLHEKQILVNPLHVIVSDQDYLDEVDIKLYEVMDAVLAGKKVTTSQPTPQSYLKLYRQCFDEGADQIICLTIPSNLSGTVQSALIAKNEHPRAADIFVHDTSAVHVYATMLLETAVRAAENGKSGEEIIDVIKTNWVDGAVLLSLKTLDVLFKSGRLSRLKMLIGNLLHVKPIVLYKNRKLEIIKKVRSERKVFEFCTQFIQAAQANAVGTLRIRLTHVNALERARSLQKHLQAVFPGVEITIGLEITSVLAIHIAYGGIGVGWIFERV